MTKEDIFEDVSKPSDFIAIREKGDLDYVLMIDSYGIVWSTRQQSLEIMKFFTRPRKRMLALPILRFCKTKKDIRFP